MKRQTKTEPALSDSNSKAGWLTLVATPSAGSAVVIVATGATVSTVKVTAAAEASVLPAMSVARTLKVCAPSASVSVVKGVTHEAQSPSSTWHSKVASVGSEELKAKVISVDLVRLPSAGPESMVVSGAVASSVKLRVAGVRSSLPARSTARTWRFTGPSSTTRATPLSQASQAPPLIEHSKVPSSVEPNSKVGSLVSEPSSGPETMVVSGWTLSTVKLRVAGVRSGRLPSPIARTWTECAPLLRPLTLSGEVHASQSLSSVESIRH